LTRDTVYSFKIEARNVKGYSAASSEVPIRAAESPDTPVAPTTSINGNYLEITWLAPHHGGSALTAYTATIRQSDFVTFTADAVNCDGSDSGIIASATCSVPITTLSAAPYNLPWGSSVNAKVSATNIVGTSANSNSGNGAIFYTYPDAPVALFNNAATTSAYVVAMTWTAGAANSGTLFIDYRLSYAHSGSDVFSTLAKGITVTSYSTSMFPSGSEYAFKVESRNAYGYSTSYSNEITFLQVQLPDAPISLANNVAITSSSVVGLTWSAGVFDGASPIIDYRVFYDQGTGTWISLKTGITSTSYTVTGLTASQLYDFKVQARKIMGYSEFSS